jgi:hypothetical protein
MGDRTYIRNLATSLIGQLRLDVQHICEPDRFGALVLWDWCWESDIQPRLGRMRPETLGRIAVQGLGFEAIGSGKTRLFEVHTPNPNPSRFTSPHPELMMGNGREILELIAGSAIVAEMADILEQKLKKMNEPYLQKA